jgi:CheY-like chemotaxis protein
MSLVGNLEDLGLGEILQIVSLSRKSGVLSLHSRGREGTVVFRSGQVIRASSSTFQQNIGEVLVQKGVIDLATLKKSLKLQEDEGFKERLGAVLCKNFSISADAIEDVVRGLIEDVVYSLFAWAEGTFAFELQDNVEVVDDAKIDPLQFMLDQGLNPQFLAMEGSRILDEKRHRGEPVDEFHPPPEPEPENVDLAFDIPAEPTAEPQQETPTPTPVTQPVTGMRKLVLVDDDAATRTSLIQLLSQAGYEVLPFEKSEDALIMIDSLFRADERPTLLVDLIMPRMDGTGILGGMELLELVHQNFSELPVLVMADYHNRDAERKVREMEFGFVIKPRKAEIADPGVMDSFGPALVLELGKIETKEEPAPPQTDKVNIGDELRQEMGEEFTASKTPIAPSTGIALLRGMLEELNDPALGGGIILLVLRFASEFMNRAVIFIVKRDEIAGLGQFGITDSDEVADAKVRKMRIPKGEESLFSQVVEQQIPVKIAPDEGKWSVYLREKLGGGNPKEIFIGPIVSEGKVVAILYGDNIPDQKPIGDTESLEIFLSQAGLAMEKALLQRRLKEKVPEGA